MEKLVPYDPLEGLEIERLIEDARANLCQIYGRELAEALGYRSEHEFAEAVAAAERACLTLGIPVRFHFRPVFRDIGGRLRPDWELSRLACYLVTMNAEPSYPAVARAQLYWYRRAIR